MGSQARHDAAQRLEAAVHARDRLRGHFETAIGTSSEFGAYCRLRAAGQQVRERQAWLNWIDDDGYRGLNAGPFELRAQRSEPREAETPAAGAGDP